MKNTNILLPNKNCKINKLVDIIKQAATIVTNSDNQLGNQYLRTWELTSNIINRRKRSIATKGTLYQYLPKQPSLLPTK